jgi:hypothetical protein
MSSASESAYFIGWDIFGKPWRDNLVAQQPRRAP